jgi:hypothetical protein
MGFFQKEDGTVDDFHFPVDDGILTVSTVYSIPFPLQVATVV